MMQIRNKEADLLDAFCEALMRDQNAAPPRKLDPGLVAVAQHVQGYMSWPEPTLDMVSALDTSVASSIATTVRGKPTLSVPALVPRVPVFSFGRQVRLAMAITLLLLDGLIALGAWTAGGGGMRFTHNTDIPPAPVDGATWETPLPPRGQTRGTTSAQSQQNAQVPALTIDIATTPSTLTVGDIFTITLQVDNQSAYAANNLLVSLPLPTGAAGYPEPHPNGWSWQQALLPANGSTSFQAVLRLQEMPSGGAVVARPQATAQGVSVPVVDVGGALVLPTNLEPTSIQFTPGAAATLRTPDGRVEVLVPPDASNQPFTLQHTYQPASPTLTPPGIVGFKRGFPTFYLNATDTEGNALHQFSTPLTVRISYTPEQLQALGFNEEATTLFWFDDTQSDGGQWVALPTNIDASTRILTTSVNHLSPFAAGEDFKPSDKYIPSTKAWQVGLFRGDATFELPIDVPEGPGGTKPEITLSYDSATPDGPSGLRTKQQSGWAGQGWTLDPGYIAAQKLTIGEANDPGHYSLVLDGKTYDLMRAEPLTTTPGVWNPMDYAWRTTDESFVQIRVEQNGFSSASRGGFKQGQPLPRYRWIVSTKDGTRYEYEEDAWVGWAICDAETPYASMETYKWLLTRVIDTHGNVINVSYQRKSQQVPPSAACLGVSGTVDYSVWPTEITWGGNRDANSPDRFKVQLVSVDRPIDLEAEKSPAQLGPEIRETRQLEDIMVFSNRSQPYQAASWELIRRYDLVFESGSDWHKYVLSDASTCSGDTNCQPVSSSRKLTLNEVRLYGSDNTSNLPPVSFTYQLTRGTDLYPQGGWNRLRRLDNNQGGVVTFEYENIGSTMRGQPYAKHYKNNHRVVTRTQEDGRGNSYPWRYSYRDPAYNSLGTQLTNNDSGPNTYPNAATVYYNEKQNPANIEYYRALLVHRANTEFRGHSHVLESDPNGDVSEHFFVQGNVGTHGDQGCYPKTASGTALEGEAILSDTSCFAPMRDREFLKGREWKTIRHEGSVTGPKLIEVEHQLGVKFYEYGDSLNERLTGLWRAFVFESQTKETAWEGGATPLSKTTQYVYDVDGPEPYGNLISVKEYLDGGVLLRETLYSYKVLNDAGKYIADRKREESIKDGQGRWLARTIFGYDGSLSGDEPLTQGDLTLVRNYYDLPLQTQLPAAIHSADQSFTFDVYGNQVTETTYEGYGETLIAGNMVQRGAAGNNSTPRIRTTEYDPIFHTYKVRLAEPNGLFRQQEFDLRLGLVTRSIDYSGVPTDFSYDVFGRDKTQVQAGDSAAYPTVFIEYYDWERPVKYLVGEREVSGTNAYRPTMSYYDGLGREIQTKTESRNCQESVVVDKVYDGLGQVTKESQPRYVNIGSQNCGATSPFWQYTPPGSQLYRPTITDFDALGRKVRVQEADPSIVTTMQYGVIGVRRVMTTTDPDRHQKRSDHDMYGRLLAVQEYSGTGTPTDLYQLYSTTSYEYTPLDLLSKVTDGLGKVADQLTYDSLGRKIRQVDLTMGRWAYAYNPSGTLKTQTDPKGQTLTVTYDALDRPTRYSYTDGSRDVFIYDQGTYGKGLRTAMERYAPNNGALQTKTAWQYDQRGRKVAEEHTVAELPGTRLFKWSYDSADRTVTTTYPAVVIKPGQVITEQVRVEYDDAWRGTKLCSNEPQYAGICYAHNAGYTALNQPTIRTLGNGLVQSYKYTDPMHRLERIQVGTSTNLGAIFNRKYTYTPGGNIEAITSYRPDGAVEQTQLFGYDHLDRLVRWRIPDGKHYVDERYYFDKVGNIDLKEKFRNQTDKESYDYIYDYQRQPGGGGPYAVRDVHVVRGGSRQSNPQTYDANGNLVSSYGPRNTGQRRALTWNAENQPAQIETHGGGNGVTETYIYSADGDRVKTTRVNRTTYYLGGQWEEEYQGAHNGATTIRLLYRFGDQVVAQREVHPNHNTTGGGQGTRTGGPDPNRDVVYLHADHLGSISVETDYKAAQGQPQQQEFDPWGLVRNPPGPPISRTSLNYTGQRLDETGLLYYISRYYDPELSRFVSPDSVVPGISDGKGEAASSVGMVQNHKLTVDFHEPSFVKSLHDENKLVLEKGFWFQLEDEDREEVRDPWGPQNPQSLNRYANVLNDPLRYTDPTGHMLMKVLDFFFKMAPKVFTKNTSGVPIKATPNVTKLGVPKVPIGHVFKLGKTRTFKHVEDPQVSIKSFSDYALRRAAERRVTEAEVRSWQQLPRRVVVGTDGNFIYMTQNGLWWVEPTGKVTTVVPRSHWYGDYAEMAKTLGVP